MSSHDLVGILYFVKDACDGSANPTITVVPEHNVRFSVKGRAHAERPAGDVATADNTEHRLFRGAQDEHFRVPTELIHIDRIETDSVSLEIFGEVSICRHPRIVVDSDRRQSDSLRREVLGEVALHGSAVRVLFEELLEEA